VAKHSSYTSIFEAPAASASAAAASCLQPTHVQFMGVHRGGERTTGHSTVKICAMLGGITKLYIGLCVFCVPPRRVTSLFCILSIFRHFANFYFCCHFYFLPLISLSLSLLTSSRGQTNEVKIISFMDFVINVARTVNVLVPSCRCVAVAIVIFSAQFCCLAFVTVFQLPGSLFCVPLWFFLLFLLLFLLLSIILPTEIPVATPTSNLKSTSKKLFTQGSLY